ncbi:MAG: hypothetical protein ACK5P7_00325 [Bdellovibrio sp.]
MKLKSLRARSVLSTIVGGLLVAMLIACQDTSRQNRPSGSVTVKVPVYKNQGYKLGLVELTTLEDLIALRGAAARFFFSPAISGNPLVGVEPRIRTMRTQDGTYVATDAFSLQLLSLYSNFEGLMKLDEQVGIKALNTWPRSIAVNTRLVEASRGQSRDNALYSGQLDAFLFVPYSQPDLPLSMNAGVIGHEHFHSFFFKLVLKPLGGVFSQASNAEAHPAKEIADLMGLTFRNDRGQTLSEREMYHVTLFRGMNEGLADVWGYLYSGDQQFVSRSLRSEKVRDLDTQAEQVPSASHWSERIRMYSRVAESVGESYALGSSYAKVLKSILQQAVVKTQKEQTDEKLFRVQMAKAIIQSLTKIQEKYQSLDEDENMKPGFLLETLSNELPFLGEESCQLIREKLEDAEAGVCTSRGAVKP